MTGGDANGRDGAGAGILLPSDMTLYITGKGRLTATGGNAASGGNGAGGGNAEISGWNFKNGGAFKIENPADPTAAAGVSTSGSAHACGTGEPSITLSPAQLEQIEQAKHKAGVR